MNMVKMNKKEININIKLLTLTKMDYIIKICNDIKDQRCVSGTRFVPIVVERCQWKNLSAE